MDTTEIARLYDFTGRTILVTGGAGVLCSDWAIALAGCGARVVIVDRNPAAMQAVIDRLQSRPGAGRIFAVEGDVLKADIMQAAVDKTLAEFGAIDGLINGAGGQSRRQQLHAVAGHAYGSGIFRQHPGQRDRAGFLPGRAESLSADG